MLGRVTKQAKIPGQESSMEFCVDLPLVPLLPLYALGSDFLVALMDEIQFVIAEILDVHHLVARRANGMNQFIELEIDGLGVAVLGVLDQKHHQESDDGGAGVDDKLPRIGILE
jgi:hypothetical protein